MPQALISYIGDDFQMDAAPMLADPYPFVPAFRARVGDVLIFEASVHLGFMAGVNARSDLTCLGYTESESFQEINRALVTYGVRRFEAVVAELLAANSVPDEPSEQWLVSDDSEVAELVALVVGNKECGYRTKSGRDLLCTAASRHDNTAQQTPDGRWTAPTSRPLCNSCQLPEAAILCSNLLHPVVVARFGDGGRTVGRDVGGAFCDLGKPGISHVHECRAGSHRCWQRIVEADEPASAPLSPLGLPEAFDVLDAMWRLAFDRRRRLLTVNNTAGVAALALPCANRPEFESRLSALADVIDLIKVDDDLLPASLTDEQQNGSINRLMHCLLATLPAEQHDQVKKAIQTLRIVRQARNAMQHSKVDGGLTPKLRALGIHDAPPNWPAAWDTIRSHTADALTIIRHELRRWVDAQPN